MLLLDRGLTYFQQTLNYLLSTSPLILYPGLETGGTSIANAGTLGGAGTLTLGNGVLGQTLLGMPAIDFDGADTRISYANTAALNGWTTFTLGGFIQAGSLGESNAGVMWIKGSDWQSRFTLSGGLPVWRSIADYNTTDADSTSNAVSGDIVSLDTPHLVVVTLSDVDNKLRIYIDGEEVGSYATQTAGSSAKVTTDTNPVVLGATAAGALTIDGLMAMPFAHDYALSAGQIATIAALAGTPP
jgi:hypothetical protein